jgi:hypothetical protein
MTCWGPIYKYLPHSWWPFNTKMWQSLLFPCLITHCTNELHKVCHNGSIWALRSRSNAGLIHMNSVYLTSLIFHLSAKVIVKIINVITHKIYLVHHLVHCELLTKWWQGIIIICISYLRDDIQLIPFQYYYNDYIHLPHRRPMYIQFILCLSLCP